MKYHCCDPVRLEVIEHGTTDVNAIEFLEVLDRGAPAGVARQQTLFVRLLRPTYGPDPQTAVPIGQLVPANLSISGGERIERVDIVWCASADALPPEAEAGLVDSIPPSERPRTLVVRTESAGDFSFYTLSIVSGVDDLRPPVGFDPRLSSVRFSFKVECPSPFDCLDTPVCPPEPAERPVIDYLAKDYEGFRRLMFDRLSLLAPAWTERSAADLGVALVELLAYAADNLSYRQDVIANEAYLHTARLRTSVRRLLRLVDGSLHDGSNARAFVHLQVAAQVPGWVELPPGTVLLTKTPGLLSAVSALDLDQRSQVISQAVGLGAQVFLTGQAKTLYWELNRISLYTWGDKNCCLPRGSTRVTLRLEYSEQLAVGDLLLFEETLDPQQPDLSADLADKSQRWVVRLTKVTASSDPSGGLFTPGATTRAIALTEVEWDAADALPFPLCVSAGDEETAVARGNIVLVDHGQPLAPESLGKVPPGQLALVPQSRSASCKEKEPVLLPPRFRPTLQRGPLTHGFDLGHLLSAKAGGAHVWPASALLDIDPRTAMPLVQLTGVDETGVQEPSAWTARRDLLDSSAEDTHFVVETEHDGRAKIRFGDDTHGKRPNTGIDFLADYRTGSGKAGNVGIGAIAHVVGVDGISEVRNPLAASGGVEPEDVEVARRDAPQAFRVQERAVTAADYATLAERLPDVQRATARYRWTGSWYTAFVTADRYGGAQVDPAFATRLRRHLEPFRMAGYDLHADRPRYVPLDLALHVCVSPRYQASDVLREVKGVLSSAVLPDGRRGLFHPDQLTFGSAVYLSPIVAAAQAVTGVDSVRVDRFQRLDRPDPSSLVDGLIPIGPLEIAQLENSQNFPERGRLKLYTGSDQ